MSPCNCHARAGRLIALLILGLTASSGAIAYSYGPENRAEWDGWPEYCKVRYAVSNMGDDSEYARQISRDSVVLWQGRMGLCWRYLHHHCAAILQLNRAKLAPRPSDRKFALEKAIGEDRLAARFCPETHPFAADIATHMAMTYTEAGDFVSATKSLDWAIRTHPGVPQSYLVKASLLRRSGKPDQALEVLLAGDEASGGVSAEIHNALGFAYLNAGDHDKAREHARRAYALGFPLPGLRDQLAAVGYPL